MKRVVVAVASLCGLVCLEGATAPTAVDGQIPAPERMDRWPTVATTYALQYEGDGGTTLNTVRLDPRSYDAYVATGRFPVGAVFQLEVRRPIEEVAPAKGGKIQGPVLSRSLHVKDEKAGPGTWTFYRLANEAKVATAIPRTQACYACHQEHATDDTAFTQFYPALTEARAAAQAER